MTYILDLVYSWSFFIGSVCGLIGYRTYCWQKVRWQNRHHPLPNGRMRHVDQLSRVWLAGLAVTLSLGYVLLTAQKTHDQTIGLTKDVARCWSESYKATAAQINLNAQNDTISRQQQQIQREFDRDTVDWISHLLAPPGDLAGMQPSDPARQAYGIQISQVYFAQINDLGREFDNLVDQRKKLDKQREENPLPETTCGK